jgi:hypothetical protein
MNLGIPCLQFPSQKLARTEFLRFIKNNIFYKPTLFQSSCCPFPKLRCNLGKGKGLNWKQPKSIWIEKFKLELEQSSSKNSVLE